jgi:hypothetical protein
MKQLVLAEPEEALHHVGLKKAKAPTCIYVPRAYRRDSEVRPIARGLRPIPPLPAAAPRRHVSDVSAAEPPVTGRWDWPGVSPPSLSGCMGNYFGNYLTTTGLVLLEVSQCAGSGRP